MNRVLLGILAVLDAWPTYTPRTHAEWIRGNLRRTNPPRMSLGHAIPQGLDPSTHGWTWTGHSWIRDGINAQTC